jgi:hypothetical protein
LSGLNILTLNLVFSTLVFWIAAQIYLLPRLGQLSTRTVLVPILLLHSLRHLGMMFLAPGATYPGIAPEFGAAPFMGAAYWIPAFWVPALLVTHVIVFMVLVRTWHHSARQTAARAPAR